MAEPGRSPGLTPRGWYRDTTGNARWRYWDGDAWTAWVANGPTAAQDVTGAPDAPPPVPASRAVEAHPPDIERQPVPEVSLPPWHLGDRPATPVPKQDPIGWLLTILVGATFAAIGAGIYEPPPPNFDGSGNMPAGTLLGPLLVVVGLLAFGIGAVGLVGTLGRGDGRRRPR